MGEGMSDEPQREPSPGAADPGPRDPDADTDSGLLDAAPALARMTAEAWWNTAAWALGSALRASDRFVRAAMELGESAPVEVGRPSDGGHRDRGGAEASLRERGAELLRRSADVHYDEDTHPAYERILEALAPDEARIIRLLATRGPQAAVDVRSGLPLASQLVALGLSMIGAEAGCRYPERINSYLNNLNRLGLVWFSRETLEDVLPYQVLEAQPEVTDAMSDAGRLGRTVRRTIHLTPFGEDFCRAALPADTREFEQVVETHSARDVESERESGGDDDRTMPDPVPPNPEPLGSEPESD
jgi:Abortive infection alpha